MVAEDDKAIYFRFGTELAPEWEATFERITARAKKTQDELDKRRVKMPSFDTGPAEKSFSDYVTRTATLHEKFLNGRGAVFARFAREQAQIEDQLADAESAAADARMDKQIRLGSKLSKQIDKDLSNRKRLEADFAKDSEKLALTLSNAWGEWNTKQAKDAETAHARAADALDKSSRQMETSLLKAGRGAAEVARGLVYLADKSIPRDQRGAVGDLNANAGTRTRFDLDLSQARAKAAEAADNARNNATSPSALADAEIAAQRVLELTTEIKSLDKDRLSLMERAHSIGIDGMKKQLDTARDLAAKTKEIADETARAAEQSREKYTSDLEKFGQADHAEQDKVRRIKAKLDAGESLDSEESKVARGYNEFSEAAGVSDRRRALAAGGGELFAGGEERFVDSQAAATGAAGSALGAAGLAVKLNSEIEIAITANEQEIVRQIESAVSPLMESFVQATKDAINKSVDAEARKTSARRVADAMMAK